MFRNTFILNYGCVFLLSLINCSLSAQGACDLKREADGVKVYTCKSEHEKFKSLRAEFELKDISIQELKNFLWDVSNYKTWQYNVIEAEQVTVTDHYEMTYRALIDAPWPVENRETVVTMKISETPTGLTVNINHTSYAQPPPDDAIRVPFFEASWTVVAEGKNLKAIYLLRIDPGGSVPAWLVNIAMADGPHVSFRNLKAQLESKKK